MIPSQINQKYISHIYSVLRLVRHIAQLSYFLEHTRLFLHFKK